MFLAVKWLWIILNNLLLKFFEFVLKINFVPLTLTLRINHCPRLHEIFNYFNFTSFDLHHFLLIVHLEYVKISLIRTKIQYLRWSHEETDRHTNLITKKTKMP